MDELVLTFRGESPTGMIFDLDANPALYSPRELQEQGAVSRHS